MESLTFATGVVTYDINGKGQISFNPADDALAEKLYNAFAKLDEEQEEYRQRIKAADENDDHAAIFETARDIDNHMRDTIDGIFEAPVSEWAFGSMSSYAMADGLPVWANLLFAVLDKMDESVKREQGKTTARMKKYTDKYHIHPGAKVTGKRAR